MDARLPQHASPFSTGAIPLGVDLGAARAGASFSNTSTASGTEPRPGGYQNGAVPLGIDPLAAQSKGAAFSTFTHVSGWGPGAAAHKDTPPSCAIPLGPATHPPHLGRYPLQARAAAPPAVSPGTTSNAKVTGACSNVSPTGQLAYPNSRPGRQSRPPGFHPQSGRPWKRHCAADTADPRTPVDDDAGPRVNGADSAFGQPVPCADGADLLSGHRFTGMVGANSVFGEMTGRAHC
jgi:hypothetical protein